MPTTTASADTLTPKNRAAWRKWLQSNHNKVPGIWLIYYKKASGTTTISYAEAVEEALCFGWIDSKAKPLDEERYMQYFGPRKANGGWSKVNKARIAQLQAAGLMAEPGQQVIDAAIANGTWTLLDEIEELVIPTDLAAAFKKSKAAHTYYDSLSRSDKRAILLWLVMAKRPETRAKRIAEVIALAKEGKKPKHLG
jgi:uncharacterized protein YdeI (YjbR/CyaY-like superfamily)